MGQTEQRTSKPRFNRDSLHEESNFLSDIGNITLTIARGRLAEGVEVGDYDYAVIIGLPYPKFTMKDSLIFKTLAKYYGVDYSIIYRGFMISSMISALIQAAGRVGRKRRGIVIVIDDRVLSLKISTFRNLSEFQVISSICGES